MNSVLEKEIPISFSPKLAEIIGFKETVILIAIYELMESKPYLIEGRVWTNHTYENIQQLKLPFWSIRTIRRIIWSLENQGLLVSHHFNKFSFDKAKWYTIDVDKLNEKLNPGNP